MSGNGFDLPDGRFGPVLRGRLDRKRGRDWRKIGLFAAAFVGVVVLLATATGVALVLVGTRSMEQVNLPEVSVPGDTDGDGDVDVEEITDVLNVLVVGSDSREGLTEDDLQALGTEDVQGRRSDTIMLLQLDPRRDKAAVLSFPRDLLVTRCDDSRGRINAAYGIGEALGIGGPRCVLQTVEELTGVHVNHYVEVNFAGFIQAVDAVGGVTFYVDQPLRDVSAGLDIPEGCVTFDGRRALGFVRARGLDNDFGRIARQQRFITELAREMTSVGTVVNVPRLFSLVSAVGNAVTTDAGLSLRTMQRIAFSLRELSPDTIDNRTVPAVARRINGAALVVAKEEQAEALFRAFREGTLFPDDVGADPPGEVTLADVPALLVLNGVGVDGLAAEVAEALEKRGLRVSETANADRFGLARTQVIYPPERREEAEIVAEVLDKAVLVPGEDGEPLTVVIGEDLDVAALAPSGTPTPIPTRPEETRTETRYAGARASDVQC